jgi:hypothetical protein
MTRARLMLLCLGLAALALPTTAFAVSPPGSDDGYTGAVRAASVDPGCRSRNTIDFRAVTSTFAPTRYRVRHHGVIRCELPMTIRCSATLQQGTTVISRISATGGRRCTMGSPFGARKYPAGTRFTENYRYELKLTRQRHRWSATSNYCPRRSENRRILICRDSHSTRAPTVSVDRHR